MAFQNVEWQKFYEKAWKVRAEFVSECLSRGMNGYQAIKELEKKERKYRISITDGEVISWEKIKGDPTNAISESINIPIMRLSSMRGNEIVIPFYANFNFVDMLIDIFDETGPYDSIIELGCGYGRNLFEIFYRGGPIDTPYFGGEFTKSGVDLANKLAKATPNMNAKFFHFNHLEPRLDIDFGERAFIFTCHSIEQVSQISDNWFEVVANSAKQVRCVHLEPFGFQMHLTGPLSQKHMEFIVQQGWNVNFTDMLKQASKNKIIEVDGAVLEIGFSQDPFNPGSIAIWHSDKK